MDALTPEKFLEMYLQALADDAKESKTPGNSYSS